MIYERLAYLGNLEMKYRSEIEVNGVVKIYYTLVGFNGNKKYVYTVEADKSWPYHERVFCITTLETKND